MSREYILAELAQMQEASEIIHRLRPELNHVASDVGLTEEGQALLRRFIQAHIDRLGESLTALMVLLQQLADNKVDEQTLLAYSLWE